MLTREESIKDRQSSISMNIKQLLAPKAPPPPYSRAPAILIMWFRRVQRESASCSVMSNSMKPIGLKSTRLLSTWDSPGKNTGLGCHSLLQGIFLTQRSNPGLLHCRQILYYLSHQGSPQREKRKEKNTPMVKESKCNSTFYVQGTQQTTFTESISSIVQPCWKMGNVTLNFQQRKQMHSFKEALVKGHVSPWG